LRPGACSWPVMLVRERRGPELEPLIHPVPAPCHPEGWLVAIAFLIHDLY
jgi:hypothetical protein